jgi:hypothetical protein
MVLWHGGRFNIYLYLSIYSKNSVLRLTSLKYNYKKHCYSKSNITYEQTTIRVQPVADVPPTEKFNPSYIYIYVCVCVQEIEREINNKKQNKNFIG